MEFSTFHSDLDEKEIKPNELLSQYVALVEKDNQKFFASALATMPAVACPACESKQSRAFASKLGFEYVECSGCGTVYTSKRPTQGDLNRFYTQSESRKFWLTQIWPRTSTARAEKILGPLKTWVETFCDEQLGGKKLVVADLYPSNWGFAAQWGGADRLSMAVIEPMFEGAPEGIKSISTTKASAGTNYGAICLLESIGRVENPCTELKWVADHLAPGGLCFLTTVLSSGFDMKVLGAQSEALLPPDRMVLFSLEGLQILAKAAGLEVVELSTPGVLDLAHVKNAMTKGAVVPEVIRYWLDKGFNDQRFVDDFQTLLQSHGLSSQGRIVLKKK